VNEQQRKDISSGCQTVFGCTGIVVLFSLAYYATGFLPRSVRPGPDVVVFVNYRTMQPAIFTLLLFGGLFFFLLLCSVKTSFGVFAVCAAFAGITCAGLWSLYARVAAIAFDRTSVELRYVWPRPAVRLIASDITSADFDERPSSSEDSALEYVLVVHTSTHDYRSFADTSLGDMQLALRRIEALKRR
jgi:hypothetical protein